MNFPFHHGKRFGFSMFHLLDSKPLVGWCFMTTKWTPYSFIFKDICPIFFIDFKNEFALFVRTLLVDITLLIR
ncbi:hypothetical protein D3C84_347810 [compost metagenome]